jgi:hypothetical protein
MYAEALDLILKTSKGLVKDKLLDSMTYDEINLFIEELKARLKKQKRGSDKLLS